MISDDLSDVFKFQGVILFVLKSVVLGVLFNHQTFYDLLQSINFLSTQFYDLDFLFYFLYQSFFHSECLEPCDQFIKSSSTELLIKFESLQNV